VKTQSLVGSELTPAQLERVHSLRVLFGHQSVGKDILGGVAALEAESGQRLFSIQDSADLPPSGMGRLLHYRIGKNGDPPSKCRDFVDLVKKHGKDTINIALMKFCYADFDGSSDVDGILAEYSNAVKTIRAVSPAVKIVHVTAPLTTRTHPAKRLLKQILGRPDESDLANLKRSEYNRKLRAFYEGEVFFDLASIEATRPDGTLNEFEVDGSQGFALVEELTDDGGHLNARGSRNAAAELLGVLTIMEVR
jgi:hypothetical protein